MLPGRHLFEVLPRSEYINSAIPIGSFRDERSVFHLLLVVRKPENLMTKETHLVRSPRRIGQCIFSFNISTGSTAQYFIFSQETTLEWYSFTLQLEFSYFPRA